MKKEQITTKSSNETKDIAKKLIKEWLELNAGKDKNLVICLEGNLGGGKTTFAQGLAEGLGIKETVNSPTFLIMKKYSVSGARLRSIGAEFRKRAQKYTLYHFDCYRISDCQEILDLGFEEIISGKNNIIAIEWSEKIRKILPKERINIKFKFVNEKTRKIKYYNFKTTI
ncbi:MAG: tRNA (adenosine(37)-N6)-threonylcarbamoyltransferase complex ATPase subunit type 1 TsaE [Patescibacteria group bacterium]|nr:tRNA (adenosine(37)-N6)-threonylcarbamoyltransferase complex ATPase subunit type 1 TsaE [Patescibacteria group bacterium]